jgi:phage gp46-like protein
MEQVKNNAVKLENWADIKELVQMSIGTDKGSWWADPDFGSNVFTLRANGKVDGKTAGNFQRMVEECLQWLASDGIAESVKCAAERTGKNEISYAVAIKRPRDTEPVLIKDVWNAF